MGGSISKRGSSRRSSSGSSSGSWYPQYQAPSFTQSQYHEPQGYHGNTSQSYGGGHATERKKRLDSKYSRIDDNYSSLEQVKFSLLPDSRYMKWMSLQNNLVLGGAWSL